MNIWEIAMAGMFIGAIVDWGPINLVFFPSDVYSSCHRREFNFTLVVRLLFDGSHFANESHSFTCTLRIPFHLNFPLHARVKYETKRKQSIASLPLWQCVCVCLLYTICQFQFGHTLNNSQRQTQSHKKNFWIDRDLGGAWAQILCCRHMWEINSGIGFGWPNSSR